MPIASGNRAIFCHVIAANSALLVERGNRPRTWWRTSAAPETSAALLSLAASLLDPRKLPSAEEFYERADDVIMGFKRADPLGQDERLYASAQELHLAMQIAAQVLKPED